MLHAEQNGGDLSSSEERVGEERFELSVTIEYLITGRYGIIIMWKFPKKVNKRRE